METFQKGMLLSLKGQTVSVQIVHDFLVTFWVTNKCETSDGDTFITWVSKNCLGIHDTR